MSIVRYLLILNFIPETLKNYENMRTLCIRRYVLGIGLVLVAIMVVINIFNIHTYLKKKQREREDYKI